MAGDGDLGVGGERDGGGSDRDAAGQGLRIDSSYKASRRRPLDARRRLPPPLLPITRPYRRRSVSLAEQPALAEVLKSIDKMPLAAKQAATRKDADFEAGVSGSLGSESMDAREFVEFAGAAAEYIADYLSNIRERRVLPAVEPGFMSQLLPDCAPEQPEPWRQVLADVERVVMPGMTHWQSPHFHGYFPTGSSFAAVVGEMLSAGLSCLSFSWGTSPAATELETHVMDWLARLLALPQIFLNAHPGPGGGVLQGSASEATLVALYAAKERVMKRVREEQPDQDHELLKTRLIAYTSDQANSSVEKAGLLASVPMRLLPSDDQGRLRAATLQQALDEDRAKGLIPCYVVATVGTTPTCAYDPLPELGELCRREGLWLHVDAAYAGTALICPEYRHIAEGAELCDSFCMNPHKWMLVNFDCSAMWVRDSRELVEALTVDRIYLLHHKQGQKHAPDYRNWQIPLGRRFRALKLWLVLRLHGAEGVRAHVRRHVALAQRFEALARAHPALHVASCTLGLVCFRVKGPEAATQALLEALRARGRIFVVAGAAEGRLAIRFAICSRLTQPADIDFAWEEIRTQVEAVLRDQDLSDCVEARFTNGVEQHAAVDIVNGNAPRVVGTPPAVERNAVLA